MNLTNIMLSTGSQIQFHLYEGVEQEELIYGDRNDLNGCFAVVETVYKRT